jgi:pyruvate dehydrogenase E1 component alpha subunit
VAVAFIGDGASNQGTTLESLNLAKVWDLPAIFVCEDNGYAESTSSSYAVAGSQIERARGFGIPAEEVDGFDFFAVHDAARTAIERARAGGGPSMIHVRLSRYYGHFEGDGMTYRGAGEVEALRAKEDCLKRFRTRVTEAALLPAAELDEIDRAAADQIESAVQNAKKAKPPTEADLLTDAYVAY